MDIGEAVKALKDGRRVSREGWFGNHHLYLFDPDPKDDPKFGGATQSFVMIETQKGDRVPWLCSQADLLADDWVLGNRDQTL